MFLYVWPFTYDSLYRCAKRCVKGIVTHERKEKKGQDKVMSYIMSSILKSLGISCTFLVPFREEISWVALRTRFNFESTGHGNLKKRRSGK